MDAFRSLVGPDVSIYAGTERQAGRTVLESSEADGSVEASATLWTREMFRGFAAAHLANGADGVYLFNFFIGNTNLFDVLAEMRSLEQLRGKAKTYRITSYGATHNVEGDLPMQVPVVVPSLEARRFDLLLSSEHEAMDVEVHIILDRGTDPNSLWLQVNDTPTGHAERMSGEPGEKTYSWWDILDGVSTAIYRTSTRVLKDGRNQIVFRNESSVPLTVLGVAVLVR